MADHSHAPLRLIHLAAHEPVAKLFTNRFCDSLREFGMLEVRSHGSKLSDPEAAEILRRCDVVLTGWGARPLPLELAHSPGCVRYICHVTGTLHGLVDPAFLGTGIPVTNWGDSPADSVAESALCLLLACLKNLPDHILTRRSGAWWPPSRLQTGTLQGLRIGLYGYGAIGRRFHELLRPFRPFLSFIDPHVEEAPQDIRRLHSLRELFLSSDAVCVHAALTPLTRRSITAELLALLPDHAVLINTARGDLIDQEALFRELESGRLRAGLDVLAEPDILPSEHPVRQLPNLILTGHQLSSTFWPDPERLQNHHLAALENLHRFAKGLPLLHRMDSARYALST